MLQACAVVWNWFRAILCYARVLWNDIVHTKRIRTAPRVQLVKRMKLEMPKPSKISTTTHICVHKIFYWEFYFVHWYVFHCLRLPRITNFRISGWFRWIGKCMNKQMRMLCNDTIAMNKKSSENKSNRFERSGSDNEIHKIHMKQNGTNSKSYRPIDSFNGQTLIQKKSLKTFSVAIDRSRIDSKWMNVRVLFEIAIELNFSLEKFHECQYQLASGVFISPPKKKLQIEWWKMKNVHNHTKTNIN